MRTVNRTEKHAVGESGAAAFAVSAFMEILMIYARVHANKSE